MPPVPSLDAAAGGTSTGVQGGEECVPALFEEQADLRPGATAVEYEGTRLSYRELDERANRLAHHLRRRGVTAGDRVGICVDRSADLVVGMLGVLKAGGVYVPLDPEYPAERLAYMAADAGVRQLLVQKGTSRLVSGEGLHPLALDEDWDRIARESAGRPPVAALPGSPAYVTYTSGSTGRPKGVMPSHRSVVRLVRDVDYCTLGPGDRVAQASSCSFDPLTWEVWGALLGGGCLVVLRRELMLSPDELAGALRRQRITSMFLTTAAFYAALRRRPDAFATLRDLLVGGEQLETRWVRVMREAGAPERLLNVYGPTEITTYATWYEVRELPEDAAALPIGHPISKSTELHVLDERMRPVPAGEPGELYIGGAGPAICYWGQPGMTAARFVPNPLGGSGERLYKSGDLVRELPGGGLEFLRRVDGQVKIRGFRVELGEIESALKEHPALAEAAVTVENGHEAGEAKEAGEAGEDGAGGGTGDTGHRRLAAFLVPHAGKTLTAAGIRGHLHERLPEYMVPSSFTVLDALPLTTNGKVDRRALRSGTGAGLLAETHSAPGSPAEELLTELWAELLGLESVGADDDFFALGGDSLLATRLVSRAGELLGTGLSLRALLTGPTPRRLAAEAARAGAGGDTEDAGDMHGPPPRPCERPERIPLSFTQQRFWFMEQMEPGTAVYNVPVVLSLRGEVDRPALTEALSALVARHEGLRTTFPVERGLPSQAVAEPAPVALPFTDLSTPGDAPEVPGGSREEARRIATEEAAMPFDLREGPLLRARLLRLAPGEYELLLTAHHIAVDAWSLDIIADELGELYSSAVEARPAALPEVPLQYPDYALWQREWLTGEVTDSLVARWRETLGQDSPVLPLPVDGERTRGAGLVGAFDVRDIDPELVGRLRRLSREQGATLYMTLLGGFQALLARWTGSDDVTVGTPVAGRTRTELRDVVGCLINMVPVRTDLTGDPSFTALLERVRRSALGAFAQQELPFDRLVEELAPHRDRKVPPLFQVMFSFLDERRAPRLAGLECGIELGWPPNAAQYALSLVVEERGSGLRTTAQYDTEMFHPKTVQALLAEYEHTLRRIADGPDRPVLEAGALRFGASDATRC